MKRLAGAGAIAALAALGAASPAAAAFDACTYDAPARTVTATLDTSHDGTLRVGAGGAIESDSTPCGAATTSNTDEVEITGTRQSDRVTIDQSGPGGPFEKPGGSDEVHFDVDPGGQCETEVLDWCADDPQMLKVIGTPGDDDIRAGGGRGLWVNLDAASDADADIAWVPGAFAGRDKRRAFGPRPLRRPYYFDPPPSVEIDGGAGDDTLTGLGGSGAGDTAVTAILRGGPDDDHLVGGGERDVLYPGAGDDAVDGSPSGTDLLSYADAPGGVTARLWHGDVARDGFGGRDRIDARHITTIRGSSHADRLEADYFGGTILGGAGDDVVSGGPDHDTLDGEDGNDRIEASWDRDHRSRGDTMHGGRGDDVLHGGTGPDDLNGGPGNDVLYGRAGKGPPIRHTLTFKGGDDLRGGTGDDVLIGGLDADRYYFPWPGGREKDTIVEKPGGGRDLIELAYYGQDSEGPDQIPTTIDLSSPGRWFATSGPRTLRSRDRGGAANIENVLVGAEGANRITGNGSANAIQSGRGSDRIDCRGGGDTVLANPGDRLRNCEQVEEYR